MQHSSDGAETELVRANGPMGVAFTLQQALRENLIDYELSAGLRARQEVISDIDRLRPLVEVRAQAIGFRPAPTPNAHVGGWGYQEYYSWLSELIGYIQAGDRPTEALMPRLLQVIDSDCAERLAAGHFNDAVMRAAVRLEVELRSFSGLSDHGRSLAGKALAESSGRTVSVDGASGCDPSFQEGFKQLAMGAFGAFRNPQAHASPTDLDPLDAVAQVLILNYLAVVLSRNHTSQQDQPAPKDH